jgi:hypothetical protein
MMSAGREATMTGMSDPRRDPRLDAAPNPRQLLGKAGRARGLHSLRIVVVFAVAALAAVAAGCVIPPDLETEKGDASVNAAPSILDVRDEAGNPFERPGPRDITVGAGRLVLTIEDPDLSDTLFVRYFLDYGLPAPTPARIECEAAPGATPTLERQITCSLVGVCTTPALGPDHIFEIEVFDRPPVIDDPTRLFRALDPPGLSSTWWWQVTCVEGVR